MAVITVVIHKDLFHLAVVQVVEVTDCILRSGNEVEQNGGGFDTSDKLVLQNN
jgi:hypothetical protein